MAGRRSTRLAIAAALDDIKEEVDATPTQQQEDCNTQITKFRQNEVDNIDISLDMHDGKYSVMISDYILNKTKAVEKKVSSARKEHIKYQSKGGGEVIDFSSGMYEVVKKAFLDYYSDHPTKVADIRRNVDSGKKTIVDVKIEVQQKTGS